MFPLESKYHMWRFNAKEVILFAIQQIIVELEEILSRGDGDEMMISLAWKFTRRNNWLRSRDTISSMVGVMREVRFYVQSKS